MPAGSYSVEALTTEELAPRERADFWTEQIGSYQSRMGFKYAQSENFRGTTVRQRTDTYQLVKYRSDEIDTPARCVRCARTRTRTTGCCCR